MARLLQKVRLDTNALDGLRGFAVFHIIVGHLFIFSVLFQWESENPGRRVQAAWSAACPDGWARIEGTCYWSDCQHVASWHDAEVKCTRRLRGSHLLSTPNLELLNLVTQKLFGEKARYQGEWIFFGLVLRSGQWTWHNGTPLLGGASSELWLSGEPNNYGEQGEYVTAVTLGEGTPGKVYDIPPNPWPMRFVCEVPAIMSRCTGQDCPPQDEAEQCAGSDDSVGSLEECHTSNRLYLMGGGSMGLFYIISGFVMAVGYLQVMLEPPRCWPVRDDDRTHFAKFSACDFWSKRLVRLAPMYILTNVVGILLMKNLAPEMLPPEAETWHGYLLTFTGLTSWTFSFPMGNPLTWTISTMLFFYLVFPVLAPRMQRLQPSSLPGLMWAMYFLQVVLMSSGLWILPMEMSYWVRMQPLVRLPIFIMGICCGLIRVHREQMVQQDLEGETPVSNRDRPRPVEEACCCCALEPVLGPIALMSIWFVSTLCGSLISVSCSGLQVLARFNLEVFLPVLFYYWVLALTSPVNQSSCLVRFFKSRVMRFLGDISLSCYMVHLLLLAPLAVLSETELYQSPSWMVFLTVFPVTIILGWFLTTCFEKPLARCLRSDKRARRETDHVPPAVLGSPVKVTQTVMPPAVSSRALPPPRPRSVCLGCFGLEPG